MLKLIAAVIHLGDVEFGGSFEDGAQVPRFFAWEPQRQPLTTRQVRDQSMGTVGVVAGLIQSTPGELCAALTRKVRRAAAVAKSLVNRALR
jgi:hypothetical protein